MEDWRARRPILKRATKLIRGEGDGYPEGVSGGQALRWAARDARATPAWVIDGLFKRGSLSIMAGAGGSQKTFLLLYAALAVADGRAWLDRATLGGPTMFIDLQQTGTENVGLRWVALSRGLDLEYTQHPFRLVERPDINLHRHREAGIKFLDGLLAVEKPELVIVDALANLMGGGDENAAADVVPILDALRNLARQHETALVLVHHTDKGGTSYRGSAAIKDEVDLLLRVTSKNGGRLHIQSEKARNSASIAFDVQAQFDEIGGTLGSVTYAIVPPSAGATALDCAADTSAVEDSPATRTRSRGTRRRLAPNPRTTAKGTTARPRTKAERARETVRGYLHQHGASTMSEITRTPPDGLTSENLRQAVRDLCGTDEVRPLDKLGAGKRGQRYDLSQVLLATQAGA
jgi:hypothetical protein